jgi:AraC-like DNA-binding protein
MAPPSRPVLVLHRDGAFREAIRRLGSRGFRSFFVTDWDHLHASVVDAPPSALLVVDPYFGVEKRPLRLAPDLRNLLWAFPSSTVIAALRVTPEHSHDLRTLGAWGISEVLSLDDDGAQEALYRRLASVETRPLQSLLERILPATVSGRGRTLLMTTAEVVSAGGKGRELARRLHLSERSVLRWCVRAGLPAPRRLTAWMRILLASSLLDDPGRNVLSVARACGYASDASLRRAMQDFLGQVPRTLRSKGAFTTTSALFLAELGETRRAALDRGRHPASAP